MEEQEICIGKHLNKSINFSLKGNVMFLRTKQWRTEGKRYKEYFVLFRSTIYLF